MKQRFFCRREDLFEALFKQSPLIVYDAEEGDSVRSFNGYITRIILGDSPRTFLVSFSSENNIYEIVAL